MGENKLSPFAYAHSSAIMRALVAVAQNWRHYIAGGYQFIEKPGEHTEFDKMIKLAEDCGCLNPLYVDTVKEFAGTSLTDFKNALTAIENARLDIVSAAEPQYKYHHFMAAIEVLEDLEPGYIKNRESIMVAAMFKAGTDLGDICQYTGLKESFVLQAVAEYAREQEQKQEQGT